MPAIRFCFVSPWGYAALARDPKLPFVGGAEVQQSFLAPELARRGHQVSMVTMDFGQSEGAVVQGVRVHKTHQPDEGLPVLRFLHPRLTSIWRAMRRADADIYYLRGAGALTGIIAAFVRHHRRKLLLATASDADFDPKLPLVRYARDRVICRYGLRRVDSLVVQTERQRLMALDTFGRDGLVVPSCYRLNGMGADREGPVLWVGTVKSYKRPDRLLDLARLMPHRRFVMIGGNGNADANYFDLIRRRANELANVEFRGAVPYADIEAHFDGGSVLVNTSDFEGFPNTFLQAWARGMPTVSYFDPALSQNGRAVALVAPDTRQMANQLDALVGSESAWSDQSQLVQGYFALHHSVESAVSQYERVAYELLASRRVGLAV